MSSPIEKIDGLIEACKARLEEAQHTLQKAEQRYRDAQTSVRSIEAELRGLMSAREIVGRTPSLRFSQASWKRRGLSMTWKQILEFVASKGERGATLDEIDAYISNEGLDLQRGAIRSQLSNYKQRGFLEAVADAQYRLSDQGSKLLGV